MNNLRRKLVLLFIAIVIIGSFSWLYTHAFLEIQLSGIKAGSEVTYSIINQRTGASLQATTADGRIKRLVRAGDFAVLVQQGETSFYATTQTKRFLGSTQLSGKLQQEKKRSFIGNDPGPCMYLVSGVLASTPCGGTVDELKFHIPATNKEPTYTKAAEGPAGILEGMVTTAQGSVAVVAVTDEDTGAGSHVAYTPSASGFFDPASSRVLPELNGDLSYRIVPFGGGLLAYTSDGSEAWQYTTVSLPGKKVVLPQPSDKKLLFGSLQTSGESLLVAFSNRPETFLQDFNNPTGQEAHTEAVTGTTSHNDRSEIMLLNNGKVKRFHLNKSPVSVELCGSDRVCALTEDGRLEVYAIAGDELELSQRLFGISAVEDTGSGILAITKAGVVNFNPEQKNGALEYSFGTYTFCGIVSFADTYVVCVQSPQGSRSALHIAPSAPNADSIDKKILPLRDDENIRSLSVYGSFIYITPELGNLIPNNTTGLFDYDPATRKRVNGEIRERINNSRIDTKNYTIINTLP